MKPLFILFCLLIINTANAQNVGIGTQTPQGKLEVKNALRSSLRISSTDFSDTTELLLSNRNSSNSGTDFSIKSIREEGLYVSSLSDLPGNNVANLLVIRPGGNVGVGTIPLYKFHVNGNSRFNGLFQMDGLNLFEFGAGVSGKELNAGKIGYNAFGQNALTFVGAGTNAANRAIYFFAEGGTTVNGPLGFSGPLRVNGNPGTSGQVLTSNGTNLPEWQSASFANNTRFSVSLDESTGLLAGNAVIATTHYNLNPADVGITNGANTFTINKTGLYHFDFVFHGEVSYSPAPTGSYPRAAINLNVTGIANPVRLVAFRVMNPTSDAKLGWGFNEAVSMNIHISAPATLSISYSYTSASPGGAFPALAGTLTGNLISE